MARARRHRWLRWVGALLAAVGALCGSGLLMGVALWRIAPRAPVRRPVRPPAEYEVRGIDVSRYQGRIDWERVAASGQVRFAFVKATEGSSIRDRRFDRNWKGAADVGIPAGAYHYFSLCQSGKAQAEHFIRVVPREPGRLPPVVDIEEDRRCNHGARLASIELEVGAWIRSVEAHYGQTPIVYSSAFFAREYLKGVPGPLWAAAYTRAPRGRAWTFWQYTDRGAVPGISGPVDQDVFVGSAAALETLRSPAAPPEG